MKRFIIFCGLIISASILFAQGNDENSALTKKERRDAEREQEFQQVKSMLDNKNFVLQADYLQDRYGNRVLVSSMINFVAVDSTEATIQLDRILVMAPMESVVLPPKERLRNGN